MNTLVLETSDDTAVRLPSTRLQPIASADVADAVAEVSTGTPLRGMWNVAGPDVFSLGELGRLTLAVQQDNRAVITDDKAGTFAGVTGDDWIQPPGNGQSAIPEPPRTLETVKRHLKPNRVPELVRTGRA